jgi:hypothetical protein
VNGWGWVIWGYGVALGAIGVYAYALAYRLRTARRRLDGLE